MMVPTIHLNGTSAEGLLEPIRVAMAALTVAAEALQDTAPNARDYYVQGVDAYCAAAREHEARLRRLADVAEDLMGIYEGIESQGRR